MVDEDLPISYQLLRDLFAYLNDTSATGYECDHRYTLSERFLRERRLPIEPMISWLGHNGAGCDCEVIFNTVNLWGDKVGFYSPDENV